MHLLENANNLKAHHHLVAYAQFWYSFNSKLFKYLESIIV